MNANWTRESRFALYARLREEFGPFSTWLNETTPGRPGRSGITYAELLGHFAAAYGAGSADAVGQQVKWAMPPAGPYSWPGGRHAQYARCVEPALAAGLITPADLGPINVAPPPPAQAPAEATG